MYCKKCGKKLDEDIRFCDRCGQSVRQSRNQGGEARRREIKELQEERINRKLKLEEKEKKKKIKKHYKNNKRTNILALLFLALLLVFIIAIVSYKFTAERSEDAPWRTTDGSVALNSTPTPEAPSEPKQTAYAILEANNTDPVNDDGYREFNIDSIIFPYPTVFVKQNTSAGIKLSAYDQEGGGTITLTVNSPVAGQAKDLMSEFSKTCGSDVNYSRAGDGWYVIEYVQNGIINHRKSLVYNNIEYLYEFSYTENSVSANDYKKYIDYIDNHFKM